MIYHCVNRVVDRRFAFGREEKEMLRMHMRMYEDFSGCQVLAYCFMSNHFHLLLEVPPMPAGGIPDAELLRRLRHIQSEAAVAEVAKQLAASRKAGAGASAAAKRPHPGYTYRMHDLSQFMKSFMQRFTQWFNRKHNRSGGLWEDTFKSVLVEDGLASRAMAAYIDLNPVRAGLVTDPADYPWSSYGEAMGNGPKSGAKKARAGLARAFAAHAGNEDDAPQWTARVAKAYRAMLLEEGAGKPREAGGTTTRLEAKVTGKGKNKAAAEPAPSGQGPDVALGGMLRSRVRYFTDGAVIGSREFVDGVFTKSRHRFSAKRTTGARKLRGNAAPAAGKLWSARDLVKDIE